MSAEILEQIKFLEEKQAKLKKEIASRNVKLRDLQIELKVYRDLSPKKEG